MIQQFSSICMFKIMSSSFKPIESEGIFSTRGYQKTLRTMIVTHSKNASVYLSLAAEWRQVMRYSKGEILKR